MGARGIVIDFIRIVFHIYHILCDKTFTYLIGLQKQMVQFANFWSPNLSLKIGFQYIVAFILH